MRWIPALPLLALLAACGAPDATPEPAPFSGDPLLTVTSDTGALRVEVRTAPQPPERGLNVVRFSVTDSGGAPVEGLQLAVQPWMVDMGHGSSVVPAVRPLGGGVYEVSDVALAMAGRWQLRSEASGPVADRFAPELSIQ